MLDANANKLECTSDLLNDLVTDQIEVVMHMQQIFYYVNHQYCCYF
jgi:hypothetical protein